MSLASGTRLGPYEVLSPLGAGGMGEVYRARDTRLGREVAIKVLPEEFFKDEERKVRFEREAKLLAAVSHPNIAVIYSFEEISGRYLLVQELLEGETLRERLATGALPQHTAVEIGVEIAHGLAAAHAKGIVHRDLKPANVFVTGNDVVKLLDFGLAKLTRPEAAVTPEGTTLDREPRTESGTVLGTMGYTSPEQLRGEAADARSDIFAFGCVLYEMLSGKSPFLRRTGAETITAIMSEDPEPLSGAGRAIAPALKEIAKRCLEKRADDRFSSAHDIALALRAFSESGVGVEAAAGAVAAAVGKRRRGASIAAVGVTVAVIAAGALIFANRRHSAVSSGLPSVLALPCTVYGAPEVAFLTDAVPGTISTLLSQVEGLDTKVPPNSFEVEKIKGDLTKLAELYQVSSFIVTSITTSPGRFALNVQLVDATSRKVRWGKQYEGPRETYNDLARQAAEGIRLAVRPAALPVPTTTVSSEAELAVRQGDHLSRIYRDLNNPADVDAAVASFTRALTIDPSFAAAAAKIAQLYAFRFQKEGDTAFLTQAESWARRALGIDPRCGEAWSALCVVEGMKTHGDQKLCIDYAVKGVAFAPRYAQAHHYLGMWIGGPGSLALFVAAGLRSFELDPLETAGVGNAAVGLCLQGRPGEAFTVLDRALRVYTGQGWPTTAKGFVLTRLGRLNEAESTLRRCEPPRTLSSENSELWRQVRFALAVAQRDDATSEALARHILASVSDSHASANLVGNAAYFAAPALAHVGRTNDAIRILEKSVEVGVPPPYDWLLADLDFQSLRGDPRFAKVLAASRDGAAMVAKALGEARARGELPKYLEAPLDDLLKLLNETRAKS